MYTIYYGILYKPTHAICFFLFFSKKGGGGWMRQKKKWLEDEIEGN